MSLEVKTLDYEIRGKEILKDISLEIHTKEFVGLVGPNGCGKSTLLKIFTELFVQSIIQYLLTEMIF